MKLSKICTLSRILFTSCLMMCACSGMLLAQEEEGPADNSSWVLGYALVILGIALGLLAVCRPGNRSAEVRIEDDE